MSLPFEGMECPTNKTELVAFLRRSPYMRLYIPLGGGEYLRGSLRKFVSASEKYITVCDLNRNTYRVESEHIVYNLSFEGKASFARHVGDGDYIYYVFEER